MKKKILIFGSEGFLGRHFVSVIESEFGDQFEIYGADIKEVSKLIGYTQLHIPVAENFVDLIESLQPNYIINFLGKIGQGSLSEFLDVNLFTSNAIIESIIKAKVKIQKLVLLGSAAEFGNNTSLPLTEKSKPKYINNYGFSKHLQTLMTEYYQKSIGLPVVVARPFNIVGANISADISIGAFIKKIQIAKDNSTIQVGNLNSYRDFLDVEDVCRAILLIMKRGSSGKSYNICKGEKYLMEDILDHLIDISGKNIEVHSTSSFNKEIDESYGDCSLLVNELGWQPTISIKDSLKKAYINSDYAYGK